MKVLTLNWGGKGTGSIDNIRGNIELSLKMKVYISCMCMNLGQSQLIIILD